MKVESTVKIFSDIPKLETKRFILRKILKGDYRDMFEYSCSADVTEYLLWSPHPSLSYTLDYLKYLDERYAAGSFYDWAIVEKISGKMIGTCGFSRFDYPSDCAEIGYVINPAYSGQGVATETAREVMRFGFEVLKLHRIEARFMEGNNASLRVMEKLGMKFEGYHRDSLFIKGRYRTIGYCSLLANEFRGHSCDFE